MRFSFRVLRSARLPALGKVIMSVQLLDGAVVPGAKATTTGVAGTKVELWVRSVALEGGRPVADRTFTLEVDGFDGDPEILRGRVFASQ